jgi:hypothetical protein
VTKFKETKGKDKIELLRVMLAAFKFEDKHANIDGEVEGRTEF